MFTSLTILMGKQKHAQNMAQPPIFIHTYNKRLV